METLIFWNNFQIFKFFPPFGLFGKTLKHICMSKVRPDNIIYFLFLFFIFCWRERKYNFTDVFVFYFSKSNLIQLLIVQSLIFLFLVAILVATSGLFLFTSVLLREQIFNLVFTKKCTQQYCWDWCDLFEWQTDTDLNIC